MRVAARCLLYCLAASTVSAQAQEARLVWRANEARMSAPQLHFLTGASLQRLKNGAAVPFDFQLTIWVDNHTALYDRAVQRIVVSYDLWEEKFSVAKQRGFTLRGASRSAESQRSVSNLSAGAAEAWCIDAISVPLAGLRPDQRIWARIDVRAADRNDAPPLLGESGLSLTGLIELFSRPARGAEQRWSAETGPVAVSDLMRQGARGS